MIWPVVLMSLNSFFPNPSCLKNTSDLRNALARRLKSDDSGTLDLLVRFDVFCIDRFLLELAGIREALL
jgi:hypothetical protein